jgi:hypothetical protein
MLGKVASARRSRRSRPLVLADETPGKQRALAPPSGGPGVEAELALRAVGAEERDLVRAVAVEVRVVTFPSDRRAERDALALTADESDLGEPVTGSGRSRSWLELRKMCFGHGAP